MLYGFKCLANGECYIVGEYQGFTDANGFHPEQVLMSRMYMPGVGQEEREEIARVHVYPNPSGERIWFSGLEMAGRAWGSVYNMYGVLVMQEEVRLASGMHVGDLPPGCYTIRLRTDGSDRSIKWVRQ
ncbi:MAG: T9SS type A sorting domain-containing protein [Flavobacteriales bacterium]